jgi:Cft2 family RNA processing exonuclease
MIIFQGCVFMQVVFLGGASGVGASCLAVQLAEQWIVVDAGVRVDRKADPLPDLAMLEGKNVRAIFVTHAHADHIGALPLVHQAFPTAPIYASRATGLLMEVMLSDALKIMNKRAMEEMELPLYPEGLVAGMLNRVRPLPIGESLTFAELPGVTVQASRAGHIAGAVSLGFTASDGSIVVSGDISITPQRTVQGALPPITRPDLLILESTYGMRLHPNRQAEELRLAQAVAEGIARGGHTLIPCFALGRGQELLLLLQAAQEKGQIPEFPIYVDGLVRRVCSTYLLLPEALTPSLQRQIRKGYTPFTGRAVTFVRDERERERILEGSPACIISSSGMLTGGPSAWYAARLAPREEASILITGYQDEESPGRRLLDLAEQKKNTLDIGGQTVQVLCHVAKYNLSAHADGGELAAYATALQPKRVALVHGDEEARTALRSRLEGLDVVLPKDGMTIETHGKRGSRSSHTTSSIAPAHILDTLPVGSGGGVPFDSTHIEELWRAVSAIPTLRIVTARELAIAWYGEATEEYTRLLLDILDEDYEQRYFVRQHALEEAYRVRGQSEEQAGDFISDLVDHILLMSVSSGSTKPVLCRAIEPGAAVRVQFPKGISYERTRFPFSAILELIGPSPSAQSSYESGSTSSISVYLAELVRNARRIRRSLSAHELARQCQEEAAYTLGEMCTLAGVSPQAPEDRLAVAKLLVKHPHIFLQRRPFLEGEGLVLYGLAPSWEEALSEPEEVERPDQHWILSVVEQYLGNPPDLYRRSIDPETGDVMLSFHFPAVASTTYAAAIEAAAEETGVSIAIAPHTHQGILTDVARRLVPAGLTVKGKPSIHLDQQLVQLSCAGEASAEAIQQAQERFTEQTGWQLAFLLEQSNQVQGTYWSASAGSADRKEQNEAISIARKTLASVDGLYKIGVDGTSGTLLLRFYFPDAVQSRITEQLKTIEEKTGWGVRIHPSVHQEELAAIVRQLLPQDFILDGSPSLHHDRRVVALTGTGMVSREEIEEAQRQFTEKTGWLLDITLSAGVTMSDATGESSLRQDEVLDIVRDVFGDTDDLFRVGTDVSKELIVLRFYFPDVAQVQYIEEILELETRTGWQVEVHPGANQDALQAEVRSLVPAGIELAGALSLYHQERRIVATYQGLWDERARKVAQMAFQEKTGWALDLKSFT